jgi:hypothetical protein
MSRLTLGAVCWCFIATTLHGEELSSHSPLLHQQPAISVQVVLGKVRLVGAGCRNLVCRRVDEAANRKEVLEITRSSHHWKLVYEQEIDGDRLLAKVDGEFAKIEQQEAAAATTGANSEPARITRLTQTPREVVLEVLTAGAHVRCAAPTIWHLSLEQPDLAQEHLFPLLGQLQRRDVLPLLHRQIHSELFDTEPVARIGARELRQLVAQLKDDEAASRRKAVRQLLSHGRSAAAMLSQIPSHELDAEQQMRVRQILSKVGLEAADAPEEVASWLADDPAVWVAILDRQELAVRVAAARQLRRLYGDEIVFDPHADPIHRRQQIAAIRQQLGN